MADGIRLSAWKPSAGKSKFLEFANSVAVTDVADVSPCVQVNVFADHACRSVGKHKLSASGMLAGKDPGVWTVVSPCRPRSVQPVSGRSVDAVNGVVVVC